MSTRKSGRLGIWPPPWRWSSPWCSEGTVLVQWPALHPVLLDKALKASSGLFVGPPPALAGAREMFAELGFVAEFLPCDFLGDTVTAVERQPAFIIKQASTVSDPFSQPSQPSSCLEPQSDALLSNSSRRVQESLAHFLSFLNVWLFSLSRVFEGIYKTRRFCECPVVCYSLLHAGKMG